MKEGDIPIGAEFGHWTVISAPLKSGYSRVHYECKCSCGLIKPVEAKSLIRGGSRGCRICSWTDRPGHHGRSRRGLRLYDIWNGMKTRCRDDHREKYHRYGGRGIFVCGEWLDSYLTFERWAVGQKGHNDPTYQLDRKDNNGPYSPDNCRFITSKLNCRNKSNNHIIEAFGERKCLSEWTEDTRCAVDIKTLSYRVLAGWISEAAITTERRVTI
jgi:hypothetical protein